MRWSKLQKKNPIVDSIKKEWINLLATNNTEHAYHAFIKDHAGFFLVDRINSFLSISKLKLGSSLETDFAVPSENHSMGLFWELFEIKTPQASPYNEDGFPSAILSKATQQVRDWKAWLMDNRRGEALKLFQSKGVRVARDPNFSFTIIIGNRENSLRYLDKRNALSIESGIKIRSFEYLTNKVRLCERSEPQSNRLLDKPGLDEVSYGNSFLTCTVF